MDVTRHWIFTQAVAPSTVFRSLFAGAELGSSAGGAVAD
jgi:hypothetical protein